MSAARGGVAAVPTALRGRAAGTSVPSPTPSVPRSLGAPGTGSDGWHRLTPGELALAGGWAGEEGNEEPARRCRGLVAPLVSPVVTSARGAVGAVAVPPRPGQTGLDLEVTRRALKLPRQLRPSVTFPSRL